MASFTFDIKDPVTGRVIAQHHRIDKPDGTKTVWWSHGTVKGLPDGTGVADLPLYSSDIRLRVRTPILIVEGEKACEALAEAGIHAYATVTGAASCPRPRAIASQVAGHHVLFWPDNDEAGMRHAEQVLAACRAAGAVATGIIDYQSTVAPLPKGFDAADLIGWGPDALDPRLARQLVGTFIESWARTWVQPAIEFTVRGWEPGFTGSVSEALYQVWGIEALPGKTVKCPMHGDRAASLWITPDDDKAICMTPDCLWTAPGADALTIKNVRIELR
jgi:hypothetical protein